MSNDSRDEPFLSRWARMKRDAAHRRPGPEDDASVGEEPSKPDGDEPAAPTQKTEDELDLTKLPRVEELTAETDISGFLDPRVPAALRNAALNRMWTLDPTIRDFIEVAENQWNWNVPGGAPFYEVMEPGSGAGALIADASSAISRALGVPQEPDVEQNVIAVQDKQLQENDDQLIVEKHSAAQHNAATDQSTEPLNRAEQQGSATADIDAASQHERAPTPTPEVAERRRHGGALPV